MNSTSSTQSWATRVKTIGDPKIFEQIKLNQASIVQQKKDTRHRKIQKQQEDWQIREDMRDERKRVKEAQHIADMREKYGSIWYQRVYLTDEDCDKADELRREADHRTYLRDQETEQQLDEEDAADHGKWRKNNLEELEADYETEIWQNEQKYEQYAGSENLRFYQKTGIMRLDKK